METTEKPNFEYGNCDNCGCDCSVYCVYCSVCYPIMLEICIAEEKENVRKHSLVHKVLNALFG